MQVGMTKINNYNNQPNFNGYVNKDLIRYVKQTNNEFIQDVLENNNYKTKILDEKIVALIKKISEKSDEVLQVLHNSVKDLHAETCLSHTIEPTYEASTLNILSEHLDFKLNNPSLNNKEYKVASSSERKIREATPGNKFLDLVNTVLRNGKEVFSYSQMKEKETQMVYDYVENSFILKNLRKKMLAREFKLPSDWFNTKKEQINLERSKKEAEEATKKIQNNLGQKNEQAKELERDKIKNQNLNTIKQYLK